MQTNLAAFTPQISPYPPYISVNRQEGGDVTITVRSMAKRDGACGDCAGITLSAADYAAILEQLNAH